MDRAEAARLLGVPTSADAATVRHAFRVRIRDQHPDLDPTSDGGHARTLIAAYRLLSTPPPEPAPGPAPSATGPSGAAPPAPPRPAPHVHLEPIGLARLSGDTIAIGAPADEAFRLLVDVAHDVGDVTYLDRSVPILEVLCRFVDEPATSLVLTVQGRATYTEVFCTVESIEARPAPPTDAVVDVLVDALTARG
ncbi:MAG: hypothetical protein KF906_03975 [Actinobacteria bacterium]|nr:hypothetical protein [Actinomycetota bacterium]